MTSNETSPLADGSPVKNSPRIYFSTIIMVLLFLVLPVTASLGHPVEMAANIVVSGLAVWLIWETKPIGFEAYLPFAVFFAIFTVRVCSFYFFGLPLSR